MQYNYTNKQEVYQNLLATYDTPLIWKLSFNRSQDSRNAFAILYKKGAEHFIDVGICYDYVEYDDDYEQELFGSCAEIRKTIPVVKDTIYLSFKNIISSSSSSDSDLYFADNTIKAEYMKAISHRL